jgi:hypothetical protein
MFSASELGKAELIGDWEEQQTKDSRKYFGIRVKNGILRAASRCGAIFFSAVTTKNDYFFFFHSSDDYKNVLLDKYDHAYIDEPLPYYSYLVQCEPHGFYEFASGPRNFYDEEEHSEVNRVQFWSGGKLILDGVTNGSNIRWEEMANEPYLQLFHRAVIFDPEARTHWIPSLVALCIKKIVNQQKPSFGASKLPTFLQTLVEHVQQLRNTFNSDAVADIVHSPHFDLHHVLSSSWDPVLITDEMVSPLLSSSIQSVNFCNCSGLSPVFVANTLTSWKETLTSLDLSYSSASEWILIPLFQSCHQLEAVSLNGLGITDLCIEHLTKNHKNSLQRLQISDCQNLTNHSLALIAENVKDLHALSAASCNLDEFQSIIKKFIQLDELNISDTKFSWPNSLFAPHSLKKLFIQQLPNINYSLLLGCTKLQELAFSGNLGEWIFLFL